MTIKGYKDNVCIDQVSYMYWWVQMINKQGISYLSTNSKSCSTGHVKVRNFEKRL